MMALRTLFLSLLAVVLLPIHALAGASDTSWMFQAKYGMFVH